jgi:peptidyl-tRNA hydrolase, PTH1 family
MVTDMTDLVEPIPAPEAQPQKQEGPYLIAGLGNPGRAFENNRHNVGFMVLNRLALKLGERFGKVEAKALVSKTIFLGERVILIKPQMYMNNSGSSVSSLVRFYKVPLENLLVVYDEVDLPLGAIRMRPGGGSAGHKGMQSIIDRMGTDEFPRLRIGMGRPPGRKDAADYVLQDFPSQESELLDETLDRAVEAVFTFIRDGLDKAMNLFNC